MTDIMMGTSALGGLPAFLRYGSFSIGYAIDANV